MSYEALTNLEDVKLTADPELLATMPLDMCLKGSQWEDKVSLHGHEASQCHINCAVFCFNVKHSPCAIAVQQSSKVAHINSAYAVPWLSFSKCGLT